MRSNRSQTLRNNEDKIDALANKLRMPRESEPNILSEEPNPFMTRSGKEEYREKPGRKGRASEVLLLDHNPDYFYSPKAKKNYGSPSAAFLSPPHSKQASKLAKCTSSSNLFPQPESTKFMKKNKECFEQTKTRSNLIESHKKTLDKIEQMLSSHGVQVVVKSEGHIK